MAFNLLKTYNQYLELNHLNEAQKTASLKGIFNRDIQNNDEFSFRKKRIRPFKIDGKPAMEVLFDHLTKETTEIKDDAGKLIKQRKLWDNDRCVRLHWIKHHVNESSAELIEVFSHIDRVKGKDKPRTYLYDKAEQYVIILEPYRTSADYYLLTAYYLNKAKGGIKQIEQKLKYKLNEVL
jgi:hypothetical protein